MPSAPKKPCTQPGCTELVQAFGSRGRCDEHEQAAEEHRGSSRWRGYTGRGHRRFREEVLARDPICVLCMKRPSKDADHYPTSRKGLISQGLNPDDPKYGRGLCSPCHKTETAEHQPGGWNAKQ